MLDAILHFLHSLYNPDGLKELIRSGGAPLICAIVFVETGFFVGFFLAVGMADGFHRVVNETRLR